jgi:hypothetical protein
MEIISGLQHPPPPRSAEIKNIQTLDDRWGIAYTSDSIFQTADGGQSWNELSLTVSPYDKIGSVTFADRNDGYAVVSKNSKVYLARTRDGGATWERHEIVLDDLKNYDANPASGNLRVEGGRMMLEFPVETSSNFSGTRDLRFGGWTHLELRREANRIAAVRRKHSRKTIAQLDAAIGGFVRWFQERLRSGDKIDR